MATLHRLSVVFQIGGLVVIALRFVLCQAGVEIPFDNTTRRLGQYQKRVKVVDTGIDENGRRPRHWYKTALHVSQPPETNVDGSRVATTLEDHGKVGRSQDATMVRFSDGALSLPLSKVRVLERQLSVHTKKKWATYVHMKQENRRKVLELGGITPMTDDSDISTQSIIIFGSVFGVFLILATVGYMFARRDVSYNKKKKNIVGL